MRNLVPELITEKYIKGDAKGSFNGAVLFADISGFTIMTQSLMAKGPEGAEILSVSINSLFESCIDSVYKNGGFVSTFGGDAFFAVFPFENNIYKNAMNTAQEIKEFFSLRGDKRTKYGKFELSVKVGLSYGEIIYRILKEEEIGAYYLKGPPFYDSALISNSCGKNEIKADMKFMTRLRMSQKSGKKIFETSPQENRDSHFFSEKITFLKTPGEFRETVNLFISFDEKTFDQSMSKVISSIAYHNGYLNRISFGDKGGFVLVLFGAPRSDGDDLEKALDLCSDLKNIEGFKFRAGISSGLSFAGFIGSKKRCEYTAIGENVNLAARLMNKARFGEILADRKIAEVKKNTHIFFSKGQMPLKGFSSPVEIFCFEKKEKDNTENVMNRKIIGREKETGEIEKFLEKERKEKSAPLIFLQGETGMGKTIIIEDISRRRDDIKWFFIRAVSTKNKSLGAFMRFFKSFFDYDEGMPKHNRKKFEQVLNRLNASLEKRDLSEELKRAAPFLTSIIGIETDDSYFENLDPRSRFQNTVWSVRVFFRAATEKNDSVLVFDGVENFDDVSKDLLRLIALDAGQNKCPIVVISSDDDEVYNEKIKNTCDGRDFCFIKVSSLEEKDAFQLIDSELPVSKNRESMKRFVFEKSEGKPLYIKNYCDYIKSKLIEDPVYDPLLDDRMPSDLYTLATSKIDVLSTKTKYVLEKAAVLGREFSARTLEHILKVRISGNILDESLKHNILESSDPHLIRFTDINTHKVLYDIQSKSVLRKTHAKIAEKMQEFVKDRIGSYYKDIAVHYEKAEKPEKACFFYEKAAGIAAEKYENADSVECYEKVLGFMKKRYSLKTRKKAEKYIELTLKAEKVLNIMARRDEQKRILEEASKVIDFTDDLYLKTQSLDRIGWSEMKEGKKVSPLKRFIQAYRTGISCSDDRIITESLHSLGCLMTNFGKLKTAENFFKRTLVIAEEKGIDKVLQKTLSNLGGVYYMQMRFSKAIDVNKKSLKIAKKKKSKPMLLYSYDHLAVLYDVSGDFGRAERYYIKSLKLAEEMGNRNVLHSILNNLSSHYYDLGEYEKSHKLCQKAMEILKEMNAPEEFAHAYNLMSQIDYRFKNEKSAYEHIDKAIEVSKKYRDNTNLVESLEIKAGYYYDKGRYKDSLELLDEILSYEKLLGDFIEILRAKMTKPRVEFELMTDYQKRKECIQRLKDLIPVIKNDGLKAELFFNLWEMNKRIGAEKKDMNKFRRESLNLYKTIYEKSPKKIYKTRLEKLTAKSGHEKSQ